MTSIVRSSRRILRRTNNVEPIHGLSIPLFLRTCSIWTNYTCEVFEGADALFAGVTLEVLELEVGERHGCGYWVVFVLRLLGRV